MSVAIDSGLVTAGVPTILTAKPHVLAQEPNGRKLSASGHGFLQAAVDPELGRTARELAATHATTLSSVLEAAWAIVLGRFTREDEIAFGFSLDGHEPILVRLRLARSFTIRELFAVVQSNCLDPASEEEPPLSLHVRHDADLPLGIEVRFDRVAYRESMVQRLLQAFLFTVADMRRGVERLASDFHAIPPADRHLLLHAWNETARSFPDDTLLHEPFEDRARLQPTTIAVETETESVTYRELDERSNRLARSLQARGVGRGIRVGICLPRGAGLIVAMLAVSKTGAAYVPLDPTYPKGRLEWMVSDAGPAFVITVPACQQLFSTALFLLTADAAAAESSTRLERTADPLDTCYVMYTSGSTGTQKGVVLQHRAVINTCDWVTRTFGVGPGDRLLFVTSPSFDLSVYDIFGVLGAGATIVVAEDSLLGDPQRLAAVLATRDVTIWNSAPAALEFLLPFLAADTPVSALRLVMLSGDFIPLGLVDRARSLFPNARLVSLGGATECAIWSNWFPLETMSADSPAVPYGRPIQNCRYYVLDEYRDPVPIGVVGELYIAGECLAQGYLNQPELTAARFLPDPFSTSAGARIYRTGDLVRHLDDGVLEILGRMDSQVKIRGFRVELAEVEAALNALPEILRAVCVADRIDASQQVALIAYAVLRAGRRTSESNIKRMLSLKVPYFMIPARVVFLAAMPLSPNGKVDRKALPAPTDDNPPDDFVPPQSPTERRIAEIWQRILNRSPVGATDDFFALGGHSLLAVRLFDELHRVYGANLTVGTLLTAPTVRALAASVDETRANPSKEAPLTGAVPLQIDGSRPPLFCLPGLGGDSLNIKPLADALGGERAVFGLQYRDARSESSRNRTIEEMAVEFAADVRRVQPHGPYYLGGFSAGGVVAFELARLLARCGEEVPLLVLLDAFEPTRLTQSRPKRIAGILKRCLRNGTRHEARRVLEQLPFRLQVLRAKLLPRALRRPRQGSKLSLKAEVLVALTRYRPSFYAGDVLLVRTGDDAAGDLVSKPHESNGWRRWVTGTLHVTTLACKHDELLKSHADAVAAIMVRAMTYRDGAL